MVSRTSIFGGYALLVVLVVVPALDAAAVDASLPISIEGIQNTLLGAIKNICDETANKETCIESITAARNMQCAIELLSGSAEDPKTAEAYGYCQDFLESSVDDLQMTLDCMDSFDGNNVKHFVADLANWLTGASTNYESCLENYGPGTTHDQVSALLKEPIELTTKSLAWSLNFPIFSRTMNSDFSCCMH